MTDDILDPEKEIKDPFFAEGDGVALCHKLQGYGANNWGDVALMMKSLDETQTMELRKAARQVRVSMSMEEFLRKFFNMYYEDSKVLAKLLGYETEEESSEKSYEDYIQDKVDSIELMKSLNSSKDVEKDFFALLDGDQDKITSVQVKFEKSLLSGVIPEGADDKTINANSENGENKKMSDTPDIQEILKSNESLIKTVEALQAKLDAAEAATKEAEKVSLIKCDDLSFVEDKEAFVTLMKSQDVEVITSVMEIMEKAKTSIEELESKVKELEEQDPMFKSMSHSGSAQGDGPEADDEVSRVDALIKAKYQKA